MYGHPCKPQDALIVRYGLLWASCNFGIPVAQHGLKVTFQAAKGSHLRTILVPMNVQWLPQQRIGPCAPQLVAYCCGHCPVAPNSCTFWAPLSRRLRTPIGATNVQCHMHWMCFLRAARSLSASGDGEAASQRRTRKEGEPAAMQEVFYLNVLGVGAQASYQGPLRCKL